MKPLEELTATETMLRLLEMDENIARIRRASLPDDYRRVAHYVGMNYDLHVEHLGRLGLSTEYWTKKREDWTR